MTPTTISTAETTPPEQTGEHVFFAMAAAFTVLVIAIIAGVGLAIGLIFVILAAVVAVVAVFMNRILTDAGAPKHDS
jgi:hypothetical protein